MNHWTLDLIGDVKGEIYKVAHQPGREDEGYAYNIGRGWSDNYASVMAARNEAREILALQTADSSRPVKL